MAVDTTNIAFGTAFIRFLPHQIGADYSSTGEPFLATMLDSTVYIGFTTNGGEVQLDANVLEFEVQEETFPVGLGVVSASTKISFESPNLGNELLLARTLGLLENEEETISSKEYYTATGIKVIPQGFGVLISQRRQDGNGFDHIYAPNCQIDASDWAVTYARTELRKKTITLIAHASDQAALLMPLQGANKHASISYLEQAAATVEFSKCLRHDGSHTTDNPVHMSHGLGIDAGAAEITTGGYGSVDRDSEHIVSHGEYMIRLSSVTSGNEVFIACGVPSALASTGASEHHWNRTASAQWTLAAKHMTYTAPMIIRAVDMEGQLLTPTDITYTDGAPGVGQIVLDFASAVAGRAIVCLTGPNGALTASPTPATTWVISAAGNTDHLPFIFACMDGSNNPIEPLSYSYDGGAEEYTLNWGSSQAGTYRAIF